MKINLIRGFLISTVFAVLLIQCKKEDSSDTLPAPTTADTLKEGVVAKIDTVWEATSWNIQIKNGFINFTAISDTGDNDAGETISFSIYGTKPGLYTLNSTNPHFAYFKERSGRIYFINSIATHPKSILTGGMVHISTLDVDSGIASGSFILNLYCAENKTYKNITQGAFTNIELANPTSISAGANSDMIESQAVTSFSTSSDKCKARLFDHGKVAIHFYTTAGNMIELNLPSFAKGSYPISYNSKAVANYYPKNARLSYSSTGNPASWGNVIITDTAGSLISGYFTLKIYNPENKKYIIIQSGTFKKVKVENKNNGFNGLSCFIDNVEFIPAYNVLDVLNEKYKITSYDSKDRPRIMLYFPISAGEVIVPLQKNIIDAYAVYINEKGQIFSSTEGSILIIQKRDSFMYATFNFESVFGNNEQFSSIKNGGFAINYW